MQGFLRRAVGVWVAVLAATLGSAPAAAGSEIAVPDGQAPAFQVDPAHSGQASDPDVFGPLEPAWAFNAPGPTNYPLIVGNRVLVSSSRSNGTSGAPHGSVLSSLDAGSGEVLWSRAVPAERSHGFLAADSGVVVMIHSDGVAHAFEIATGKALWSEALGGTVFPSPPVASDGEVYFHTGNVHARSIETGEKIWSTLIDVQVGGALALDSERVYVGDECGTVAAVNRTTGEQAWRRFRSGSCFRGDVSLSGETVYGEYGYAYDVASGASLANVFDRPTVISKGRGFAGTNVELSAFSLSGGGALWQTSEENVNEWVEPLGVNSSVYLARAYYFGDDVADLRVFEQSSGDLLYRLPLPYPGYSQLFGARPGMAAGEGHLYVSQGLSVVAMEPMLKPSPNGVDAVSLKPDVTAGQESSVVAGLGQADRGPGRPLFLKSDPFPYGSAESTDKLRTRDEGTVEFEPRVLRNMRFVVENREGARATTRVFAYPKTRVSVTGDDLSALKLRASLSAIPLKVLAGRSLVAYHLAYGESTLRRLGSGRLSIRDDKARAAYQISLPPESSFEDTIAVCAKGLPAEGYGRPSGFSGECGADEIAFGQASRSMRPRSDSRTRLR